MNIKKTLIIAVLFVAIVGYYAWDQKRLHTKEAGEKLAGRLVKPDMGDLTGIELENDGKKVVLDRKDGQWMLEEPIKARTDKTTIDGLLRTLDTTTREDSFKPEGDLMKDYGIGDTSPKAVVTATSGSYTETITLGNKTSDGGKIYARTGAGQDLFTVPAALEGQFTKTAQDLRDKRLLPATITEATSVTLNFSGQTIAAVKREGQWQITEPVAYKGDNNAFADLLKEWNSAKASDFVDTGSLALSAYGLDTPFWTGTIYLGQAKGKEAGPMTLKIGNMPTTDSVTRYAMAEGDPTIFQVQDRLMDKLRPTVDSLRDKSLFTLASKDVGRIVFAGRKSSIALKRDSAGLWQFDDGSGDRVDQGAVNRKLNDLLALKATRIFTPAPPDTVTGLNEPFVDVTVFSTDGKTSEGLKTASSSPDKDFVYGYDTATGDVVGVDFRAPGQFMISRDDLLDHSRFEIDESLVKKIEVIDAGSTTTLTQADTGSWTQTKAGQTGTTEIDAGRVMNMLYSLTSLTWDRRLDPSLPSDQAQITSQGLENPVKSYILIDGDGAELARLGLGGQSTHDVYVTTGSGQYYTIDKGRFGSFTASADAVLVGESDSTKTE